MFPAPQAVQIHHFRAHYLSLLSRLTFSYSTTQQCFVLILMVYSRIIKMIHYFLHLCCQNPPWQLKRLDHWYLEKVLQADWESLSWSFSWASSPPILSRVALVFKDLWKFHKTSSPLFGQSTYHRSSFGRQLTDLSRIPYFGQVAFRLYWRHTCYALPIMG